MFQVAADNLLEGSFTAKRLICEHVTKVGGVCKVEITPQLLVAASGARQRYHMYLDEEKRTKEKEARKRDSKHLEDEINDVKSKKKRLIEDIACMQKSVDSLAEKAETQGKLTLIAKSNSLRRTVAEKKVQLGSVENQLDELLQKLKNA